MRPPLRPSWVRDHYGGAAPGVFTREQTDAGTGDHPLFDEERGGGERKETSGGPRLARRQARHEGRLTRETGKRRPATSERQLLEVAMRSRAIVDESGERRQAL